MHRKGRSREMGRPPSKEAQNRTKFTTKLNKTLIRELKKLAVDKDLSVNVLIEEAVRKHWRIK